MKKMDYFQQMNFPKREFVYRDGLRSMDSIAPTCCQQTEKPGVMRMGTTTCLKKVFVYLQLTGHGRVNGSLMKICKEKFVQIEGYTLFFILILFFLMVTV